MAKKNKDNMIYYKGDELLALPQNLLDNKDKWVIEDAPRNIFYKIAWACNDTIL